MRKICSIILLGALLLGLICPVQAAQSDSFEENITWSVESGILTILGTGAMRNYTAASQTPWYSLREQITSVILEEGITEVGDLSFAQCSRLVSVSLPDSLERIGKNAFWGCRELKNVVLPEKLTELESGAFFQCASLSQISIPAGVTVLEQAVFAQCEHLDTAALHDGIVEIKQEAFSRCYALKHITLPVGLKQIGRHAFFGCAQLQQLTFPRGVTRIEEAPFYGCVNLKTLRFMGSAPVLHEKAFLDIEAAIVYSMHDASWDGAVQSGYGGNITWTKECFHEYTMITTLPGCQTEGYTTYTCSLCADTYRDLYIPALGHSYELGKCTVCGAADPDFRIAVEAVGEIIYTVSGSTVTVTHDTACKVGYLVDGAYVKIDGTMNPDGSYSFTAPEGVTNVLLVISGDVNGDGKILAADKSRLNAALLKKTTLSAKEIFAADVNDDGKLLAADKSRLNAVLLKKTTLTW